MLSNNSYEISIIIPSYKPQSYLWECLDSIQKQTLDKELFEVIIVLNGCNEPFRTQIVDYISNCLNNINIKFIQTNISGVSNARNIGLEKANGQYICFIDDDDYISNSYLEELLVLAHQGYLPLSYALSVDDVTKKESKFYVTKNYEKLHRSINLNILKVRSFFSGPCYKLIAKEIIDTHRFDINIKNGEDSLFMFSISDRVGKLALTSKNAIYYRRIRLGSACQNSNKHIFLLLHKYTKVYLRGLSRYNFIFYLTRMLGYLKSM